jgi:aminomethyltransferase
MAAPSPLKKTPLNSVHRALGAKMVDFGGWDMPVQYSGIIDEHQAVRCAVGLFDVSHMGEIEISGPEAAQFTDFVTTNAVSGSRSASAVLRFVYEHGGFVDDVLVHKVATITSSSASTLQPGEGFRARGGQYFRCGGRIFQPRYAQVAIRVPRR